MHVLVSAMILASGSPTAVANPADTGSAKRSLAAWEEGILNLACNRSVVLLGENSHGDGATIATKARLVPLLVDRCGFSAIAFESSTYDFAQLTRVTPSEANYDKAKLLAAIGGLWNRYTEFAPLGDWLAAKAPAQLAIRGVDAQLGAAGTFYAASTMFDEIAATLPVAERPGCREMLSLAYAGGSFGQKPNKALDQCLAQAIARTGRRTDGHSRHLLWMTQAVRKAVARATLSRDDYIAARDRAMADEILAFRESLPRRTKMLVWTANSHAAYGELSNGERPMAALLRDKLGQEVFAIGFSAAGGRYRWSPKEIREVPAATVDSLESSILGDADFAVATKQQLAELGVLPGAALSNHRPQTAEWSAMFDALIVLRREEPTTPIATD